MNLADISVFDLREIEERLELHYSATHRDGYTAPCGACGEQVTQDSEECSCCGTPVVWRNSWEWKRLYGSSEQRIRELTLPGPDEDDELGRELLAELGRAGFANTSQKKRWDKARRNISEKDLRGMINHVLDGTNKRGVLSHLLNWTDKVVREAKPKSKSAPQKGTPQIPSMPGE